MNSDPEIETQLIPNSQLRPRDREVFDPKLALSDQKDIDAIAEIESMTWTNRVFRKLNTGSLRGVVLMWIRMTLGIGILTLPVFVKVYGAFTGLFIILFSSVINYITYVFIFRASYFTGQLNYPDLIQHLLGKNCLKIFRVTYMLDVCSTVMIYCIVSWNLFEYCLWFFGLSKDEWILNKETLQYNENNPEIITMRYIFFLCVFLVTIPLFLKKSMDDLQIITVLYLAVLFLLVIWLLLELPFFVSAYQRNNIDPEVHYWKTPTLEWPSQIFGLLICYYVQPFIFSLRGELLLPTLRRTQKVAKISVLAEGILFSLLGFLAYIVFGDKFTPTLLILRAPYPEQNEFSKKLFQSVIAIFLVLNTFGLSMYNSSIRDYISMFYNFKDSRVKYTLVSLLPFAFICLCSAIYPKINDTIAFFGYTVYNFNGYIIPFMMAIATIPYKQTSRLSKIGYFIGLGFFISLGVTCIVIAVVQTLNKEQFNQKFQQILISIFHNELDNLK